MTGTITIHKLDASGHEVWAYPTRLLARGRSWVRVEGIFDRNDVVLQDWVVRRGDRMVELFFDDRWYNVFAVHDGSTGGLRGWYCNITRPARLEPADVYADDLALDLVVFPDGRSRVLDEDEFAALSLSAEERSRARRALEELQELSSRREGPFAESPNESAPAQAGALVSLRSCRRLERSGDRQASQQAAETEDVVAVVP